jgi:serine/threonine protein kinase
MSDALPFRPGSKLDEVLQQVHAMAFQLDEHMRQSSRVKGPQSNVCDLIGDLADEASLPHSKPRHRISTGGLLTVRDTLLDHGYRLNQEIGAGGFASIYSVWHVGYDEQFAVKVMDLAEAHASSAEITNLLPLLHPHIIKLYDTFEDESYFYLVMEYCPGGTLKEKVVRDGPLTYPVFQVIAEQILKALGYCHSMRIAHLDIKPPNVFFDAYGRVRLGDFGLSRHFDAESSFGGSIPYMSPEIIHKVRGFDPVKSDIWSLGITFYYCATGRLPWTSTDPAGMMEEIKSGEAAPCPTADKRIMAIVAHMLKVSPDRRATIDQLLEMVETDGTNRPIPARPAKARKLHPVVSLDCVRSQDARVLSHSVRRSPVRWVDSHLRVGEQRKFGCLQSFVEDSSPPAQPDISIWAKGSDLTVLSSSIG